MKQLNWRAVIGSCFGLGYSPVLPASFGALVGVGMYAIILWSTPDPFFQNAVIAICFLGTTALTVLLGPWAEEYWDTKDPSQYVLDEVAGFLFALLLFQDFGLGFPDFGPWERCWYAFAAFRAIDMIKIYPAKKLEKIPGGWGIVLDDLLAAIYARSIVHAGYLVYIFS